MSHWDSKDILFAVLAAVGALVLLFAAGVETYGAITGKAIHLRHAVYIVGLVIGFVGFYGLSPKRAREGAEVLVASGVQLIGAIRSGRRKSDAIVPVPVIPPPDPAVPPSDATLPPTARGERGETP